MSSLKVLTLVHLSMVPPQKASAEEVAWADWKTEYYVQKALRDLGHKVKVLGLDDDLRLLQSEIDDFKPDIVFNLLEEFAGEAVFDQNIVSFLELVGVPYTGCNPQGLTMGRDKAVTKKILNYHGILTPQFQVARQVGAIEEPTGMSYPMIVKSLLEEASLGISQDSVVKSFPKLAERVEFIHNSLGTPALIEEYIPGREIYVGVLGNQTIDVLPPWELDFGDLSKEAYPIATRRVKFNEKYVSKHGIRRGPAKGLSRKLLREINELCQKAFIALRLSGYARMDLRVTEAGEIYFLEVNPNPELARGEDLANAAQHAGLTYKSLIERILTLGLARDSAA